MTGRLLWLVFLAGALTSPLPSGAAELVITLQQAMRLLLESNPEVRVAQRALEAARADVISAQARPNPTLSIDIEEYDPERGIGAGGLDRKELDSTIRLEQLIERGGKRGLRTAAAERLAEASAADLVDVIRQQKLAVANAFYDLLFAQERMIIVADIGRSYEETVAAVDKREKSGDVAAVEVARIRAEAMRAANDLVAVTGERDKARIALAVLLGRPDLVDLVAGGGAQPPPAIGEPLRMDELISQRPDVRAAAARVESADRRRELARASRKRDVTVGIQYEHQPPVSNHSFGVGVSIPLHLNYRFQGEIARAEAEYAQARASLTRVQTQASADLQRLRRELSVAAERSRRLREDVLPLTERVAQGAEFAYRRGATSLLDLLDARRTLRTARIDTLTAAIDYARAEAVLAVNAHPRAYEPGSNE